jgi:NIMA (never in mitosis gene a)-related kinase 2
MPTSSSLASLAAALGQPSSFTLAPSTSALSGNGSGSSSKPLAPILHRDLKPENVFLTNQYVKLGDFGLSKELQADFTKTYVGTPYYMSPELAQGQAYDAKSDIWALGCIIFELCALSPPFDAKTQDELTMKIRKGAVPRLPPGYSDILAQVINEMLSLRVSEALCRQN